MTAQTQASDQTFGAAQAGGIACLALCTLLGSLSVSSSNVALPVLASAFGGEFHAVQWVVLAYLLAGTGLIVSVGKLGDLLGQRRLLLCGLSLFAAASLACGAAPSLEALIAARAAQGVGAAAMTVLGLAMAAKTLPGSAGKAMGLIATMSAIGTALGPSLGGALIVALGWRAIFLVNLPLALLAIVFGARFLPRDSRQRPGTLGQLDLAGTALLCLAVMALCLAATLDASRSFALALGGSSLLSFAAFLRVEMTAAAPLVPLRRLRDRTLAAGLGLTALVSMVMMGILVIGPFYLAGALGLGVAQIGLVLSVGPVVVALTGVPAGRLADALGASRMTIAGLALMALGCLLFAMIPAGWGAAGFVTAFVVLTLGYSAFQTANNAALIGPADVKERGTVSGLLSLCRNLGLILGASVMGAAFAAASGASDVTLASPGALAAALRLIFGSCALGLLLALIAAACFGDVAGGSRSLALHLPK